MFRILVRSLAAMTYSLVPCRAHSRRRLNLLLATQAVGEAQYARKHPLPEGAQLPPKTCPSSGHESCPSGWITVCSGVAAEKRRECATLSAGARFVHFAHGSLLDSAGVIDRPSGRHYRCLESGLKSTQHQDMKGMLRALHVASRK